MPRSNNEKPPRKLRLVKVITQAVLAWDDGETLTEKHCDPVVVKAADWPNYPARLATDMAELEQADEER